MQSYNVRSFFIVALDYKMLFSLVIKSNWYSIVIVI